MSTTSMALVMCPTPGPQKQLQPGILPLSFINHEWLTAGHHVKWQLSKDVLLSCVCKAWESLEELPSVERFMSALQESRNHKNPLAYVQQLFLKACFYGFDIHGTIGNYFLELFAGCRSMSLAQQVFYRLPLPDEYSCSSLIQGFCECGELEVALSMLPDIQACFVQDFKLALMAVLRACFELGYIECTHVVHIQIIKEDLERDVFFGSALVRTYTKCSLLAEAQDVFDEIPDANLIMWNTLIAGYVDHGLSEEVMRCLREMEWQALPLSPATLVYGLRACVDAGCIGTGRELCTEVFKEGFEQDPFVGSAMLNMFAKCGSLAEAQDIFDELPFPNLIVWNTLLSGYLDHCLYDEALMTYGKMRLQGLPGSVITLACALKACANTGGLELGQDVHAQSILEDYHLNEKFGTALLELYTRCGLLEEALDVFSELSHRDVFSWTALIVAFTECGFGEKALSCLEWMQLDGVSPNSATYVCSLKACGNGVRTGHQLHLEIMKRGFENEDCLGNTLVDMYGKCGLLADAQRMFEKLPVQDVISYTTLISRYTEYGFGQRALQLLNRMVQEGLSPSAVTYLSCLKACASSGSVERGKEIYMNLIKHGFESSQATSNMLVDMYIKCGFLEEAHEVFNQLKIQCDISWNTLIMGYAEYGLSEEVLRLFQEMHAQSKYPNAATFLSSLKACGNLGAIDYGRGVHSLVLKQGHLLVCDTQSDMVANDCTCNLCSALIDMYCKCGSMGDAQHVFDSVSMRETGIFNSLITGYACQGESAHVFHLLDRMEEEDRRPDEVTFLSVLAVCNHDGLLDKGLEYFRIMVDGADLVPAVKHYTSVVDLLCRAGQLDEAVVATTRLMVQLDNGLWTSVVSACYNLENPRLWQASPLTGQYAPMNSTFILV